MGTVVRATPSGKGISTCTLWAAMALGVLNRAALPVPSVLPALAALPANEVTTPAEVILRMQLLP